MSAPFIPDGVYTPAEEKAIKALQRLADKWPKTLLLFSASGSLHVMPSADYRDDLFDGDRTVWIDGISNDGGDPDWKAPT
ncbi:MAG: hypothetical protein JWO46_744 [Nocardioidaceae bacterium]|nr:hypothetical protein [Nocardioidaceae bacterium]